MQQRFETFTVLIAKISRSIRRIKAEEMSEFHLKGPHVSCLYYLTQLGPLMAASSSWCSVSLLMGLSVNSRQLRRVRMASRVFINQCLLF